MQTSNSLPQHVLLVPPSLDALASFRRLSCSHPVCHLHLGCSAMQRVCEPRIASELLVALASPVVGFPLRILGRLDGCQSARTVLVQVRGCLLHGSKLAGPFLFRQVGAGGWSGWASAAVVSWPGVDRKSTSLNSSHWE